jgi:hypothetical protein
MLPLSDLSSLSTNTLSTILNNNQNNKDKPIGITTSVNSIYSCSGDVYRQCRRVRNMAIAAQQKQHQYSSNDDNSCSMRQTIHEIPRPRLSRFWNTVRLFQVGLHHRNQTSQYAQQINDPDLSERRITTAGPLQTIEENESAYQRANIEVAEPVFNELTVTMPVIPQPMFISLSNNDQDDEQDTTPVTGQTLCKVLFSIFY